MLAKSLGGKAKSFGRSGPSSKPPQLARARASTSTSSKRGEPPDGYLAVARVLRPHGVQGEMVCEIVTDFPERFKKGVRVFFGIPPAPTEILRARCDQRTVTLGLRDVSSRDHVEQLRGSWILISETDAHPLPDGQFYWHQLIGLNVRTDEGALLGELVDIMETGSNDVYVVRGADREILLPAIPDVIQEIDVTAGTMLVHLIPGLDEL